LTYCGWNGTQPLKAYGWSAKLVNELMVGENGKKKAEEDTKPGGRSYMHEPGQTDSGGLA